MNVWLWAAEAMLLALIPAGIACFRGTIGDRLAALELGSAILILELIVLSEGLHRSIDLDLPLTLAFLSFGAGMVFARFLQRWL